ncbi:MAG: zinc-dependent alcohol dehydrogenase family protein [Gemmatimonadota bacterium]|nr:zinc-dependent alcohol dehydrogenase family protein [Gemmatimonadota bacterium]
MRAMVLHAISPIDERPLVLEERPVPEPGLGELLVRVRTCGVCRTDLHVIEGDLPERRMPIVPGHQVVGVVERRGPECSGPLRPGDRVGIAWLRHTCGTCRWCRAGQENLCPHSRYTGWHEDGGYADFATVPEAFAYPVPDGFDDLAAAPLLCAGIIGYRALRRARVPDGGRVLLYGFGSSAHVVLQVARHRGCEVQVVTRGASHRDLARRMGAAWVGEPGERPAESPDGAIIFAPAGEIVPEALRAVRPGGTVACAGIHMSPVPSMPYEECLFHEKTLCSVEANTREDGHGLLREAAEAAVEARVTEFPLEEANEALRRLKDDGIDGSAVLRVSEAPG